jgi:DNA-binding response OmpR family regulator
LRLLIIEDDRTIAGNLYEYMQARGHVVDAAPDGVTGLHLAVSHPFDAIVLDLGLPGMDGLALLRRLRDDAKVATPVLVLTARDTLSDKLDGFREGADDYVLKPFSLREVEARLEALHKRSRGRVVPDTLRVGELSFDRAAMEVRYCGQAVRLPPKAIRLLEALMTQPGRVLGRAELEQAAWDGEGVSGESLRTQMSTLRKALAQAGPDPIENMHGLGYRVRPPDAPPA